MARVRSPKDMACIYCHKLTTIPYHRQQTYRFCSRKCNYHWHKEQTHIKVTCAICSVEFLVIPFRAKTAKYCSRKCYYQSQYKQTEHHCSHCGKAVMRRTWDGRHYKSFYCSIECRHNNRRKSDDATTSTAIRSWMKRRGWLEKCERCGLDSPKQILVIHHKNRDRKNNTRENLECLCPNCHATEHYVKT